MSEVRGLREDMSRDRHATVELANLRKRAADRRARSRANQKSRDGDETVSQDSPATAQVVRAVAFVVGDQDQERKEKSLESPGTVTPPRPVTAHPKPATGPIWLAYSTAYRRRYGAEPVRNAKVNGQLAQLAKRLGDDAAEVAAFYVGHSGAYYGQRGHCVDALLRDCEKLRTEWATGRQITGIGSRLEERTSHTGQVFRDLLPAKGA